MKQFDWEFEVCWTSWVFGVDYFNSDPTFVSQDVEKAIIFRIGPIAAGWSWTRCG